MTSANQIELKPTPKDTKLLFLYCVFF